MFKTVPLCGRSLLLRFVVVMGKYKRKDRKSKLFVIISVILIIISASAAIRMWSVHYPAGFNGALRVKNGKIVNRFGRPFVLQGVSTNSLQTNGQYIDKKGFRELKNKWNVNCVRLSLKTYGDDGYCRVDDKTRAELNSKIRWGVQCATECGLYVIIDWHILEDRNPNRYRSYALEFFSKMAQKYKNQSNVIFEICNEPNNGTTWTDVKEYAESVAGEIRSKDNRSLIITGTPDWCQQITDPLYDPVIDLNTAYSYHFYAASHKEEYRDKLRTALEAGLPVVVSEFGISEHTGDGKLDPEEGEKWLSLLDQYDVGRICWSLSKGKESSKIFKENCPKTNGWEDEDLTEYGMWIREQYNKRRWNPVL